MEDSTAPLNRYRSCMAERISDLGDISKTERKIHFAMSAKICSYKARNVDEAYVFIRRDHPDWFTESKSEYKDIFKRFGIEKE